MSQFTGVEDINAACYQPQDPSSPDSVKVLGALYAQGVPPQLGVEILFRLADRPPSEPFTRPQIYPETYQASREMHSLTSALALLTQGGIVEPGPRIRGAASFRSTPLATQAATSYNATYKTLLEQTLQYPPHAMGYQTAKLLRQAHALPISIERVVDQLSEKEEISPQHVALRGLQSLARLSGHGASIEEDISGKVREHGNMLAPERWKRNIRFEYPKRLGKLAPEQPPNAAFDLLVAGQRRSIPTRPAVHTLFAIADHYPRPFTCREICNLENGTRREYVNLLLRLLREKNLIERTPYRGARGPEYIATSALSQVVAKCNQLYTETLVRQRPAIPQGKIMDRARASLEVVHGPSEQTNEQGFFADIAGRQDRPRSAAHVIQWGLTGLAYAHGMANVEQEIHMRAAALARMSPGD